MGSDKFIGITHIGFVRQSNEDRYLIKKLKDKSVLIAVADGLGVEVAGDYAAEILKEKLAGLNHISRKNELPELDQLTRIIEQN
jgi:serine/threonine protein phosphatase PrpC